MSSGKKIAVFISGRGSNMCAIIESTRHGVLKGLCEVVLVFSDEAQAAGLHKAGQLGIPTICLSSKNKPREEFEFEIYTLMKPFDVEYIVLAGFKRILSPYLIKRFPGRIVNIHPADPHDFKGLNGYAWAFNKRLAKTAITVHFVDEGVDTGTIIDQLEIDISKAESVEEVQTIGLKAENEFYPRVLASLFSFKDGCKEVRPDKCKP